MPANTPTMVRPMWPVMAARMVAAGTVSTPTWATVRIVAVAAGCRSAKVSNGWDMNVLLTYVVRHRCRRGGQGSGVGHVRRQTGPGAPRVLAGGSVDEQQGQQRRLLHDQQRGAVQAD